MSHAEFTGKPYITRRGVYYAHPTKWWIRTDWSGWFEVRPPVRPGPSIIKRFPPHTYWTHVLPYINDHQNGA